MKLLNEGKVNAAFDRIIDLAAILGAVLVFLIMLSVALDVVMRYFLGRPMIWVLQMTEIGLLYITFLGAAWVLRKEGHVKMDLLLTRLSPRRQAVLNFFTSILGAVICLVIVWYGAQTTWDHFQRSWILEGAIDLPLAPFLAIIPIGVSLLFIQFLRRSYGSWQSWKASIKKEQGLEGKP